MKYLIIKTKNIMKESRKEFIKEAHKSACNEWKQKIENEFPKLFKSKLEPNNWFKDDTNPKWIAYYSNDVIYGLNSDGDWFYNDSGVYNALADKRNRLATDKEVEEALIKEAEKRGFVKGCKWKRIHDEEVMEYYQGIFYYRPEGYNYLGTSVNRDCLILDGNEIYAKGKWAEIVTKTITKAEAEKQLNAKIID